MVANLREHMFVIHRFKRCSACKTSFTEWKEFQEHKCITTTTSCKNNSKTYFCYWKKCNIHETTPKMSIDMLRVCGDCKFCTAQY